MRIAVALVAVAACSAPDPEILSTTVLGATRDTTGPYRVDSVIAGADGDDLVQLLFSVDGTDADDFAARTMSRDGERFTAAIPGQPAGTDVLYFVRVLRDGDEVARDPDSRVAPSYGFQILRPDGSCLVDSDCAQNGEACREQRCTALPPVCTTADDCRAGYDCNRATGGCVVRPRPCSSDQDCPAADRCDGSTASCVARRTCSDTLPCPDGSSCNLALGRCY